MDDIQVSLAFGAVLVIAGGTLIRWHFSVRNAHLRDESLADRERFFYRTQFRRRVQTSALIILLGILLPVLDLIIFQDSPRLFTVLVCTMLMLAFWIMALGALDWFSQRVFNRATRSALSSLARKRRELEEEVERLRQRGSNGRH